MRALRDCGSHFPGGKDCGPRKRDLLPERHGEDGRDDPEAVRDTDRYPDGTDRSSERMDPCNRIMNRKIMGCQLIKVGIFFINLFTMIWQNAMIEHGKIKM